MSDGEMHDASTCTAHDSKWCPECNGRGKIVDIETIERSNITPRPEMGISGDWNRVRARTYECRDCGGRWRSHV
jgi:hypothetical protein